MTDNVFNLAERRTKLAEQREKQAEAERAHREQQEQVRIRNQGVAHRTHEQKAVYAARQRSARQLADLILGADHFIKSDLSVTQSDTEVKFTFQIENATGTANVTVSVTPTEDEPDA